MTTTFATPIKETCEANCTACLTGFHNYCDGSMECNCSKPGWTDDQIDEIIIEEMEKENK